VQNHKSAFCVGHSGKGRATLVVRDAELKGNDPWCPPRLLARRAGWARCCLTSSSARACSLAARIGRSDGDRPGTDVQERVMVNTEGTPKPTHFFGRPPLLALPARRDEPCRVLNAVSTCKQARSFRSWTSARSRRLRRKTQRQRGRRSGRHTSRRWRARPAQRSESDSCVDRQLCARVRARGYFNSCHAG